MKERFVKQPSAPSTAPGRNHSLTGRSSIMWKRPPCPSWLLSPRTLPVSSRIPAHLCTTGKPPCLSIRPVSGTSGGGYMEWFLAP